MTKLELLNRKMLECEINGDISEEEYATYKQMIEAVRLMEWTTRCATANVAGLAARFIAEDKIIQMKAVLELLS